MQVRVRIESFRIGQGHHTRKHLSSEVYFNNALVTLAHSKKTMQHTPDPSVHSLINLENPSINQ